MSTTRRSSGQRPAHEAQPPAQGPAGSEVERLVFREVQRGTWCDLEQLFESRGGPRHCWFIASFAQGLMLGRYITGFDSGLGYLLFGLVVGAALCGGYVLLGATWLIFKTEGTLQKKAVAWAR